MAFTYTNYVICLYINSLRHVVSIYLPTLKLHFYKEKRNFLTCKLGIKIAVQGSLPSLNCQFT